MLVLDWGCLQWQSTTDIIVLCVNHPKTISEAHHKNYAKKNRIITFKIVKLLWHLQMPGRFHPSTTFFFLQFPVQTKNRLLISFRTEFPIVCSYLNTPSHYCDGRVSFPMIFRNYFFYHTLILNFRFPALGTWNRLKYPCLRTYIYLSDF